MKKKIYPFYIIALSAFILYKCIHSIIHFHGIAYPLTYITCLVNILCGTLYQKIRELFKVSDKTYVIILSAVVLLLCITEYRLLGESDDWFVLLALNFSSLYFLIQKKSADVKKEEKSLGKSESV